MARTFVEFHGTWDVRRVTAGAFKVRHQSEHGSYDEMARRGDVVLVASGSGDRDAEPASAFTRLSSYLPPAFESCRMSVADVLEKTELVGTYEGELPYGSAGAFLLLMQPLRAPSLASERRGIGPRTCGRKTEWD
jgi:hypothetical protein